MSQSAPPIGVKKLAQVAIVVHDIDRAIENYRQFFGTEPENAFTTPPGHENGTTYQGQPTSAQAKLAFFNLDNIQLELIQPLGGDSVWQKALDEKGEHVHHLAFWVKNPSQAEAALAAQDAPLLQRGDFPDRSGYYAYFGAEANLGAMMELLVPYAKENAE